MFETTLLISKAAFAAVGCTTAIRLARMSRREGGDRVHGWVSTMIFLGGIGLLGFAVGPALAAHSERLAWIVMFASDLLERAALIILALFIWHAFRRGQTIGAAVLSGAMAILLLDWIQILALQRWPLTGPSAASEAASQIAFAVPFAWATSELLLEYLRSRRKLRLDLTDAQSSHRFLLWTLGCGCFAAVCVVTALAITFSEIRAVSTALTLLCAMLYLAIAAVLILGFFPPRSYQRWVDEAGRLASAA